MNKTHYSILIIGGGTAGINVAARLRAKAPKLDIAIVDPSEKHYYQPLWTLVGGGVTNKEVTEKNEVIRKPDRPYPGTEFRLTARRFCQCLKVRACRCVVANPSHSMRPESDSFIICYQPEVEFIPLAHAVVVGILRSRLLLLPAAVNTFLHALEPSKARKSYSLPSRREGVPRSAATRMGRFSGQLVEGLGNNSGLKTSDFRGIERRKEICWSLGSGSCEESDTLRLD